VSITVHSITATVQDPVTGWDGILDVVDARITLDEGWAPYCQADITIGSSQVLAPFVSWQDAKDYMPGSTWGDWLAAFPGMSYAEVYEALVAAGYDRSSLDPIDPRNTVRITLTVTQEWLSPVRDPQTRTFDLMLRERTIDHVTGQMTLKLESDEGVLIDDGRVANTDDSTHVASAASLRTIIANVLTSYGATLQAGTADFSFTANTEPLVWEPGTTAWEFLEPLVQTAGLRLFCDEQRQWWLVESASYTVAGQVNIAAAENLTSGTDVISRYRDWYDSVVVRYRWDDTAGVSHVQYDSANPSGTKTLKVEWNRPYPGAGAAAAVLARAEGRGRTLALDALSDYTATPGMSLVATLPATPIQTGVVSAVAWVFAAEGEEATMTVESRGLIDTPATAWALAAPGLAWNEIPVGTDWTEYTP